MNSIYGEGNNSNNDLLKGRDIKNTLNKPFNPRTPFNSRYLGPNWVQPFNNVRPRRSQYYCLPPQPSCQSVYIAPMPPAVSPPPPPPPLSNGWQWRSRNSPASQSKCEEEVHHHDKKELHSKQDDDELLEESDEELSDSVYDSDASQKSFETRKQNKWFHKFFEEVNGLSAEQLSETSRQWHCPACQNAPGAIDWYNGLRPLITHAKTKGARRAKLHRELAKLIEEELRLKGTHLSVAGEIHRKWKGLCETTEDYEIVWPPMVVVMNTLLTKDDNDKWLGMGNQELLEYFSNYDVVKARQAYGPRGHRGMSLLIFEATATGYMEAERLDKHFCKQGTDRDAWEKRRVLFYPGGKRQLYGYLANENDIKLFNLHSKGKKAMLKYEVRSYQEMVVIPIRQMSEDNQQLTWLKHKVVKQENRSKALEETFHVVSQKLRETMEENRIVRLRTKMQHEENKEEMDYQERFFKEQMEKIQKDIKEKEQKYQILLQEESAKAGKSAANSEYKEECMLKEKEREKVIYSQVTGVEEIELEMKRLVQERHKKKMELNRKYLELEKEFNASLTNLMEKLPPSSFATSNKL